MFIRMTIRTLHEQFRHLIVLVMGRQEQPGGRCVPGPVSAIRFQFWQ